jgi:hypothetical protein
VRTDLLMLAQGWRDHDDADALRQDAALRLAVSDRKSSVALQGIHSAERCSAATEMW